MKFLNLQTVREKVVEAVQTVRESEGSKDSEAMEIHVYKNYRERGRGSIGKQFHWERHVLLTSAHLSTVCYCLSQGHKFALHV